VGGYNVLFFGRCVRGVFFVGGGERGEGGKGGLGGKRGGGVGDWGRGVT